MSQYKLTYFAGRARAETSRLLFAMADKKYEDNRITGDAWTEYKKKTPFGQLPCLEVDDVVYAQSHAIERYLAKEFGLYGDTSTEQLFTDMVIDTLEGMFTKIVDTFGEKDEAVKQARKDTLAVDTVLPALRNIENLIRGDVFMLSNKISWADLAIYSVLENLAAFKVSINVDDLPKLKKIQEEVAKHPRIADWLKNRPETSW